jgi:hypothetical protein|tara:strand:- start:238 stop:453 length:216 start_codon:yes stop_codon:yes gene_type:complete
MSESGESELTIEDVLRVAADRLVYIRVLEKAANEMQNVINGLKNDIAEINNAMFMRDSGAEPVEGEAEEDE